jgi:hypothetical protein
VTSPRRLLVLCLGALVLSSCGGGDENGGPDDQRPPQAADRLPVEPREAPPAGVAEQVSFFEIGNGGCPTEAGAPQVTFFGGYPDPTVVEIGRPHFQICLLGFSPEGPVDVSVRRPDGREVVEEVPSEGDFPVRRLPWLPLPGDPLGRYEVTASQGSASASGAFVVRRGSTPRVTAVEPYVPPGEVVRLVFAGFAPRQTVRFHVYRAAVDNSTERHSYLTSLTTQVDENGETLHEIQTEPRAPEAKYLVRVSEEVQYPFHLGEVPGPPG